MSEINSNYGMESLNIAMCKKAAESQGQISLALLEGAVAVSEQVQSQAQAAAPAQAPKLSIPEGALGANIDTYA